MREWENGYRKQHSLRFAMFALGEQAQRSERNLRQLFSPSIILSFS